MNRTRGRLKNLLVAICGDQINSHRPKIEALVATLNANARFAKARQDGGRTEETTLAQVVPLLCWEVGEAPAPIGRKRNCQRLTAHARRLRR